MKFGRCEEKAKSEEGKDNDDESKSKSKQRIRKELEEKKTRRKEEGELLCYLKGRERRKKECHKCSVFGSSWL
ncbi:hypothetical protein VNO77_04283 [Canavalia gladiata]|uniref:Uncharacterized protein n=1 Tax=Canavalia gladiata TaxID=3824 RepID=A0AAN9R8X4_CANGL